MSNSHPSPSPPPSPLPAVVRCAIPLCHSPPLAHAETLARHDCQRPCPSGFPAPSFGRPSPRSEHALPVRRAVLPGTGLRHRSRPFHASSYRTRIGPGILFILPIVPSAACPAPRARQDWLMGPPCPLHPTVPFPTSRSFPDPHSFSHGCSVGTPLPPRTPRHRR